MNSTIYTLPLSHAALLLSLHCIILVLCPQLELIWSNGALLNNENEIFSTENWYLYIVKSCAQTLKVYLFFLEKLFKKMVCAFLHLISHGGLYKNEQVISTIILFWSTFF